MSETKTGVLWWSGGQDSAFTAEGLGSVSGLGTKIPQAVHIAKKTKQKPAMGPCYLTILSFKTLESWIISIFAYTCLKKHEQKSKNYGGDYSWLRLKLGTEKISRICTFIF